MFQWSSFVETDDLQLKSVTRDSEELVERGRGGGRGEGKIRLHYVISFKRVTDRDEAEDEIHSSHRLRWTLPNRKPVPSFKLSCLIIECHRNHMVVLCVWKNFIACFMFVNFFFLFFFFYVKSILPCSKFSTNVRFLIFKRMRDLFLWYSLVCYIKLEIFCVIQLLLTRSTKKLWFKDWNNRWFDKKINISFHFELTFKNFQKAFESL